MVRELILSCICGGPPEGKKNAASRMRGGVHERSWDGRTYFLPSSLPLNFTVLPGAPTVSFGAGRTFSESIAVTDPESGPPQEARRRATAIVALAVRIFFIVSSLFVRSIREYWARSCSEFHDDREMLGMFLRVGSGQLRPIPTTDLKRYLTIF